MKQKENTIIKYMLWAEGFTILLSIGMFGYSIIMAQPVLTNLATLFVTWLVGSVITIFGTGIAYIKALNDEPDTRTPWEKAHDEYVKNH